MRFQSISYGLLRAIKQDSRLCKVTKNENSNLVIYFTEKELKWKKITSLKKQFKIETLTLKNVMGIIQKRFTCIKNSDLKSNKKFQLCAIYGELLEQYGRNSFKRRSIADHFQWICKKFFIWLKGGFCEDSFVKLIDNYYTSLSSISSDRGKKIDLNILDVMQKYESNKNIDNINTKILRKFIVNGHPDRRSKDKKGKTFLYQKVLQLREQRQNEKKIQIFTRDTRSFKDVLFHFRHMDFGLKLLAGSLLLLPSLVLFKKIKFHLVGFAIVTLFSYLTTYHRSAPTYKIYGIKYQQPTVKKREPPPTGNDEIDNVD